MDFHKFQHITVDEARKAHAEDEKIQMKFGVKYLQFWVNEEAGTIFCLVEGPDKKTVESVHQMAHGHVACAMVEVDPRYYAMIMGENVLIDRGLVVDDQGGVDLGYRSILVVALRGKPTPRPNDFGYFKTPVTARETVIGEVSKFNGRIIKLTGDDHVVSVFNTATRALLCAHEIQNVLLHYNRSATDPEYPVTFTIGLGAGQPVTQNNEFIEETIRLATRLSLVADADSMVHSSLIQELCDEYPSKDGLTKAKVLTVADESFLMELFEIMEAHISDEDFTIDSLVRTLGTSRPQLYRKTQGLTGRAPLDLIRHLRMEKALTLLKRKSGNISEVALQVGFSNPSYFAKCFAAKFGCLPSKYIEAVAAA